MLYLIGVQIWHLWLSPWRRTQKTPESKTARTSQMHNFQSLKSTLTGSMMKESQLYDSRKWEYYVASNLHMYTTLFVLFIQSPSLTRDLSTSTNNIGVVLLSKTLSLYSPALLNTLDSLNKGYELILREKGNTSMLNDMSDAEDIDILLYDCISLQDRALFPGLAVHESRAVVDYRTLIRQESINIVEALRSRKSECSQGVMEIGVQSLIDALMTMCGVQSPVLSTDRENDLKEIEAKLCEICSLQASDLTAVGGKRTGELKNVHNDAERITELTDDASLLGTLTPAGKAQLLQGRRVCDKSSIVYRKDPLTRPFLSTDLRPVVKFLVQLSKAFNSRYDLPACKDSIYLSWGQMVERDVFRYEAVHGASTAHPFVRFFYYTYLYAIRAFVCFPQGFRFNLRSLGNVIVICKMVALASTVFYLSGHLTLPCFIGTSVMISAIMRSYGWHHL